MSQEAHSDEMNDTLPPTRGEPTGASSLHQSIQHRPAFAPQASRYQSQAKLSQSKINKGEVYLREIEKKAPKQMLSKGAFKLVKPKILKTQQNEAYLSD